MVKMWSVSLYRLQILSNSISNSTVALLHDPKEKKMFYGQVRTQEALPSFGCNSSEDRFRTYAKGVSWISGWRSACRWHSSACLCFWRDQPRRCIVAACVHRGCHICDGLIHSTSKLSVLQVQTNTWRLLREPGLVAGGWKWKQINLLLIWSIFASVVLTPSARDVNDRIRSDISITISFTISLWWVWIEADNGLIRHRCGLYRITNMERIRTGLGSKANY
jgi:hypothetical protein